MSPFGATFIGLEDSNKTATEVSLPGGECRGRSGTGNALPCCDTAVHCRGVFCWISYDVERCVLLVRVLLGAVHAFHGMLAATTVKELEEWRQAMNERSEAYLSQVPDEEQLPLLCNAPLYGGGTQSSSEVCT